MKTTKIFLIAAFCLFAFFANSQEHLKFNDVPLNGSAVNYAKILTRQGFTIKETNEKVITMSGNYMNRPCEVMIYATKLSNVVRKVSIIIPVEKMWSSIKNDYFDLKQQFITKYGAGKSCETFTEPYFEGDGYELKALKSDKCNYSTDWEVSQGSVSLILSKYKQIVITYQDAINSELQDKEELERVIYE